MAGVEQRVTTVEERLDKLERGLARLRLIVLAGCERRHAKVTLNLPLEPADELAFVERMLGLPATPGSTVPTSDLTERGVPVKYDHLPAVEQLTLIRQRLQTLEREHYTAVLDYEANGNEASKTRADQLETRITDLRSKETEISNAADAEAKA